MPEVEIVDDVEYSKKDVPKPTIVVRDMDPKRREILEKLLRFMKRPKVVKGEIR